MIYNIIELIKGMKWHFIIIGVLLMIYCIVNC